MCAYIYSSHILVIPFRSYIHFNWIACLDVVRNKCIFCCHSLSLFIMITVIWLVRWYLIYLFRLLGFAYTHQKLPHNKNATRKKPSNKITIAEFKISSQKKNSTTHKESTRIMSMMIIMMQRMYFDNNISTKEELKRNNSF